MSRPLGHSSFPSPYQQNDIEISPSAFWICVLGAGVVLAYLIHELITALQYRVRATPEILWNCFVWLMPARLVLGLGPSVSQQTSGDRPNGPSDISEHAAKSEVLKNVFKLNGAGKAPKNIGEAPPGLGNWDNSCYQNSVLQALASIRCLATFLDHLAQNIADLQEDTTAASLNNLITSLNKTSSSSPHIWTPRILKSMSSWQQQDAQEYFSKLVDEVEKDTAAGLKNSKGGAGDDNSNSLISVIGPLESDEISQLGDAAGLTSKGISSNPGGTKAFQSPLEGMLAQRVGCTRCGFSEGISLIPFNCLTLPLGKSWSYDVQDCFEEYTSLESIEGVECAKCSLLQMKNELRRQSENITSLSEEEEGETDTEEYKVRLEERLEAVTEALNNEDFSETTLARKCQIPGSHRVASTKSKQVTIMKPPQCLVMHVNRSLFDENTGAQMKNYADVQYPNIFDMSRWCIGNKVKVDLNNQLSATEEWEMNPSRSMIASDESSYPIVDCRYQLRAVITHLGRHENGHYVCYRSLYRKAIGNHGQATRDEAGTEGGPSWWRLSDENVTPVSEDEAFSQGGAFMLFYERLDHPTSDQSVDGYVANEETREAKATATVDESSNDIKLDLDNEQSSNTVDAEVDQENTSTLAKVAALTSHDEAPASAQGEKPEEGTNQELELNLMVQHAREAIELNEGNASAFEELQIRSLSPAKMRTAGVHRRGTQDGDSFKLMAMVAPT